MNLRDLSIDTSWCLFLDRDGVINHRIIGGYARNWDQFRFINGVTDALRVFSERFGVVVVVSNQQGVGKGLMTDADVQAIHRSMISEIAATGGRIDRVYYAPSLASERSFMRKPGIGMALMARKDFPSVIFRKSLMVGDSLTDMIFGKRVGMKTVLIAPGPGLARAYPGLIDFVFPDLLAVASELAHNQSS